ncbi:MAG: hypothetical protein MJZ03_03915 [archaeon]|nr:hypothetical protein [archaeon]
MRSKDMELHFYNIFDARNVLNKRVNTPIIINGTLKGGSSILSPVINADFLLGESPDVNYVYIPAFKRYYFIEGINNVNNNIWQFALSIDVLMSHKSQILNIPVIASRSSSLFDPYLPDSMVKDSTQVEIYTRAWGGGSFTPSSGSYVLAVNGV